MSVYRAGEATAAGRSDLRFVERTSELTGAGVAPLYAALPAG